MSEAATIHRVQFRMRSGESARELENLAWREYEGLRTNAEKQRFLSECFSAGYALMRAGVTRDASLIGLQLSESHLSEEKTSDDEAIVGNTVNKDTQKKMGGLISAI